MRSVRGVTTSGVVVVASTESTETQLYRVRWDSTLDALTDAPGVHDGVVGADAVAVHATSLDRTLGAWRIDGAGVEFASVAQEPDVAPRVTLHAPVRGSSPPLSCIRGTTRPATRCR